MAEVFQDVPPHATSVQQMPPLMVPSLHDEHLHRIACLHMHTQRVSGSLQHVQASETYILETAQGPHPADSAPALDCLPARLQQQWRGALISKILSRHSELGLEL